MLIATLQEAHHAAGRALAEWEILRFAGTPPLSPATIRTLLSRDVDHTARACNRSLGIGASFLDAAMALSALEGFAERVEEIATNPGFHPRGGK